MDTKRNVWVTAAARTRRWSSSQRRHFCCRSASRDRWRQEHPTGSTDPRRRRSEDKRGGGHRRQVGGTPRRVIARRRYRRVSATGARTARSRSTARRPYDPNAPISRQFGTATCVRSQDDLKKCLRSQQQPDSGLPQNGTFIKEGFVEKQTMGIGSVWDLELSPDEKFVYVGDAPPTRSGSRKGIRCRSSDCPLRPVPVRAAERRQRRRGRLEGEPLRRRGANGVARSLRLGLEPAA